MIFTLLARVDDADLDSIDTSKLSFTDVTSKNWYAASAQWAYNVGLVRSSTFDGDGKMSREDIAVTLSNYLRYKGYTDTKTSVETIEKKYKDIKDLSSDYKSAMALLYDYGIMNGSSSTTFGIKTNVTRSQMATILYRIDKLLSK
jgi:hypothetical protein